MKMHFALFALAAWLVVGAGVAGAADPASTAEKIWLRSMEASDLVPPILSPAVLVPRVQEDEGEGTTESSSQRLSPDAPSHEGVCHGPVVTTSQGYRLELQGPRLKVGIPFYTETPEAQVVAVGLAEAGLEILTDGEYLAAAEVLEGQVLELDLDQPDTDLPPNTLQGRLRRDLGAGRFTLRASSLDGEGPWELRVQEPESSVVLHLSLQRSHYVHGQVLQASLRLVQQVGEQEVAVNTLRAEASLLVPGATAQPVRLVPNSAGGHSVRMPLDARNTLLGEDWELRVQVVGMVDGQRVLRSADTSFRVAFAAARFQDPALVKKGPAGGMTIVVPVEVSVAGRYAVTGVLYDAGEEDPRPLAEAHTAAPLEAGKGSTMALTFGPELFSEGLPHGPLELRDLRLEDLTRKSLVQSLGLAYAWQFATSE